MPHCTICQPESREQHFIEHPTLKNLSDVHHAGKAGLNSLFPVGTLWWYCARPEDSPCQRTLVRVNQRQAFTSGQNYSSQPEDACAKGKPCWFIGCEIVSSPFHEQGKRTGYPPHTLAPAAVAQPCGCPCEVADLRAERDRLTRELAAERGMRRAMERQMAAARKALR